jgi:hypothetical protein
MGNHNHEQEATLENPFGHKEELTKKFGFVSMLGVGFVITGYVSLHSTLKWAAGTLVC